MRPIPKAMLIHSATLCRVFADEYGNPTDQQTAVLEQVRFEPRRRLIRTRDNTELQSRLTLFVDARASTPHGVEICVGDAVWWLGERFVVADVQALYDARRLHHWEVTLIGG